MSPLKEINQQAYYNAINRSTDAVNSGIFIDFMLQEIYETLKKRQGDPIITMKATKDVGINVGINEQRTLELIRINIEGNTLSESQITDILDGKHIVAPIREIQEVRNAIKTYNSYHTA